MLRIAFAGAGMVAELHRDALTAVDEAVLVGVYDPDSARCATRSHNWAVQPYGSLEELLADRTVDAVYVLSPAETHVSIAKACLNRGRHVLIEKPVSFEAEEIEEIAAISEQTGLVAMAGHNYSYIPEFRRMERLVRRGDLGTIRAAWVTYAIAHAEETASAYGGVLNEVMVHHAYLTLALLGAPSRVYAGIAEPAWTCHPAEDQAWMTWEFNGRTTAHLFASFAVGDDSADPWTFVVKILGTRGSASMSWRTGIFQRAKGSLSVGIPAYEESYEHLSRAFVAAVTRGSPPLSTLEDAARVSRIVVAANEAAATGTVIARRSQPDNVISRW